MQLVTSALVGHICLLLCALTAQQSKAEESTKPSLPPEVEASIQTISRQLGEPLMHSFLTLDSDDDGMVSLRQVLEYLMARGFAKSGGPVSDAVEASGASERYRRSKADGDKMFVKALERDASGNIGLAQVVQGFEQVLRNLALPQAPLDTDGDGKLSLSEFAISVPSQEGDDPDEEVYTALTREVFAMQDVDKDGVVVEAEWVAGISRRVEEWMHVTQLTMLIGQADKDADKKLTRAELGALLPQVQGTLPNEVPMSDWLYWIRELPHEQRHVLEETLVPKQPKTSKEQVHWSKPAVVHHGKDDVLIYRAALFEDLLVVEAVHQPGWHSYAMDNSARAKARAGKDAEHELPTLITLGKGVEPMGIWHQADASDYSKPDIDWHTWGFADTIYFTRSLAKRPEQAFTVTINAQVCNAEACAMAKDLALQVTPTVNDHPFPHQSKLVPVRVFPIDKEVEDKVSEHLKANASMLPSKLAETVGVSEGAVVESFPRSMHVPIAIDQFGAIWTRLQAWEKPVTIVVASGSVFEIKEPLPSGAYGRGYFNIGEEHSVLHGHLKPDKLAAIYLIKKPFRERHTCQCAFYDTEGNRAFTVYVGRDASGEMDQATKTQFETLWADHL